MTTEPKAEGVEAVATYGMRRKGATEIIGIVPPKVHAFPARRKEYLAEFEEVPLYTHPTTPAVEALARAAERLAPWMSAALGDDNVCAEMKADAEAFLTALAHPEIAALLKEQTP